MENYRDKYILAPMVRIGTLPMRLLALDYGADLVYTEEIVDHRILQCERRYNPVLDTIDYCAKDDTDSTKPVFRTSTREKSHVVFQMGTSSAERALAVARLVSPDVSAIDINMGCPKPFSLQDGMGAALLSSPLKIKEILTTLVEGCPSTPITCKIRVLDSVDSTLELCRLIERCGVTALAVHGRTKDERPAHPNRNFTLRHIANSLSIPVIANGGSSDFSSFDDVVKFRAETGCASVMIARAAEHNPSIFSRSSLLPTERVVGDYLRRAVEVDNSPSNTKYCLQQLLRGAQTTTEAGRRTVSARTLREMCDVWGVADYYDERQTVFQERRAPPTPTEEAEAIEDDVEFINGYFESKRSPKMVLHEYCLSRRIALPDYASVQRAGDKRFQTVLRVDGRVYRSRAWAQNRRRAEQASAIVAIRNVEELRGCLPREYRERE